MKITTAILVSALSAATLASAQDLESAKRTCRSAADMNARSITQAIRAKVDPASVGYRDSGWLGGVHSYMADAASRAPYMSEGELAALGYSYCVERRPTEPDRTTTTRTRRY